MSIVKYVDKRTGRVTVYESTPHYDPATKQSRPKRKYLGTLDPVTGELVPSSGRPGRRPGSKNLPKLDGQSAQPQQRQPQQQTQQPAQRQTMPGEAGREDGSHSAPPATEAEERERDELEERVRKLERRVRELEGELGQRVGRLESELERRRESERRIAEELGRTVGA